MFTPAAIDAAEPQPSYARAAGTGGVGRFVPGHWGLFTTSISNPSTEPIELIAATSFDIDPHCQYGRRVWLPPRSRRTTYYPAFAPTNLPTDTTIGPVNSVLIDQRLGGESLIPTRTGEMLHSGLVTVLHESLRTGMISDGDDGEVREVVRAMRMARELPVDVAGMLEEPYPNTREIFAALDQLVVSSDRLLADAAALQAVRQWLYDGGTLWLLLDHVSPELVHALIGEAAQIETIDRVDLSQFQIDDARSLPKPQHGPVRELDEPVEMLRVAVDGPQVVNSVAGWPAAMWLEAGRGRVLLTTVGPRGWYRPPIDDDVLPAESARRSNFIATAPLNALGVQFLQARPTPPLAPEVLEPQVRSRIGYQVVPRATVVAVLGLFCAALTIAGVMFARSGNAERLGVVGPMLAIVAALVLVGVGARSRTAVPATVVTCQFAEASPDVPDIRLRGTMAIYEPSTSSETLAAKDGGVYQITLDNQAARQRRMLWTDLDQWHWQNVEVPQGVHIAPFSYETTIDDAPLNATAMFGPQGLTGALETGPFAQPSDGIIATTSGHRRKKRSAIGDENGRRMALRLAAEGSFASGASDVLARGQYFADATLDDDQRRRQAVLIELLQSNAPLYPTVPTVLAWCQALDVGFEINSSAQQRGDALVAIPLTLKRTPADQRVLIPAPFLSYESIARPGTVGASASYDNVEQSWIAPLTQPSRTLLRFALPDVVLPITLDEATLEIDIKAPGRTVTYSHFKSADDLVEVARESSPVGTFRYRIDRPAALTLDAGGGWLLEIDVGEIEGAASDGIASAGWQIDDIRLELRGTTRERRPPSEPLP